MIAVRDLQIGDFINTKNNGVVQITVLSWRAVGYEGGASTPEHCSYIPLTEEILVKNGWDFRKRHYAVECKEDGRGIVELSKDEDGYYWSINWDEYAILRVHYVHELQHILRLCGLEKEITI